MSIEYETNNPIWHSNRNIEYAPKNAILHSNRAMAFIKTKQWMQAEIDCSLAIKSDEKNLKAYWRRAISRKNQGDYVNALADLQHALVIDPSNQFVQKEIKALEVFKLPCWAGPKS